MFRGIDLNAFKQNIICLFKWQLNWILSWITLWIIELNFCDFKAYNFLCNRGVLGFESRPGKAFSQRMIRHSLNRMQHKIIILYLMRLLAVSKQLLFNSTVHIWQDLSLVLMLGSIIRCMEKSSYFEKFDAPKSVAPVGIRTHDLPVYF